MGYKILFSNLGYAKGIDGSLWQHIARAGRHFYASVPIQEQALGQFKSIIAAEDPDLCCIVEIDRGSFTSRHYNQLQAVQTECYPFSDIDNKYGADNPIGRLPFHKGKSNAFLAKTMLPFEKLYFTHGSKRLIYRLTIAPEIAVYFAHFSLNKKVRVNQFKEVNALIQAQAGLAMILADFNIMQGFAELAPLLEGTDLRVMNDENLPTFQFHNRRLALDLCICSKDLAERAKLKVVPQPFSDHAALLVEI